MLSPERLEFAKKYAAEGVFFRMVVRAWKGNIDRVVTPEFAQDEFAKGFGEFNGQVVFTRQYRITELGRLHAKSKHIRVLLHFAACRTKYGFYLHSSQAPDVLAEIRQLGADMKALNDAFMADYDAIRTRAMEQYLPAIRRLWTDWFKYPGEPTANFIEDEMRRREKAFPDREKMANMFRFDIIFGDPLLLGSSYSSAVDVEANRMVVYRAFFDSILKKRSYWAAVSLKFRDLFGTPRAASYYQSLLGKVVAYRRGLFYPDKRLSELLESLHDRLIVSTQDRNPGTLRPLLDQMAVHLAKDPFFRIEVDLERKV